MACGEVTEAEKAERCALAKCPLAGQGDGRCADCTGPVTWKDGRGAWHGRARSCTNCPMDGKGLPVCFAGCPGPNTGFQTDGQSMVTLGGMEGQDGADAFIEGRMAYDARLARLPRADVVTGLPPETEAALLKLLRIFTAMTQQQVLTLHAMLNGDSSAAAARRRGVTKQAGAKQIQLMAERFPELAGFFAEMRWVR